MDGQTVEVDFQLGSASGVVIDVAVGSDPVIVTVNGKTENVQAIIA